VAQADVAQCKDTADALERLGLETVMAHDGVEAILTLQRTLPRAVVLDAALSKMYGFQICELVKRNESLRATWLILVGALHHPDRYHRPPNDLYGADAYVESSELPDALPPILRRFGLPVREPSAVDPGGGQPPPGPEPAPPRPVAVEASAAPAAPAAPASPTQPLHDGLDAERAKAERLARIIISDIMLYNEEKFAAAVRSQDPLASMVEELEEGRTLFRQRIDARVREERDHLAEELLRVARARSTS
jgi:CheY-like chemotaxis protein